MVHSPGFLKMVDEARPRVKEISADEARARMASSAAPLLLDVREDSEWEAGRLEGAAHLGKGVLERDLERVEPDRNREVLMYCGGGYRSILAADAAQKMGYARVFSVAGGYKTLVERGWKVVRGA